MKPRLTFLLAALTLLAACGRDVGRVHTSTDYSESPDTVTGAPATHDDGAGARPELREPQGDIVDALPRSFDSHKATGRKVTLVYYSGVAECYGLDRIEIDESSEKVVLTIYEGRRPEAEICPEIAVQVRSIATLERPLGNRKVIDGAR